jgi:hypothetical protein
VAFVVEQIGNLLYQWRLRPYIKLWYDSRVMPLSQHCAMAAETHVTQAWRAQRSNPHGVWEMASQTTLAMTPLRNLSDEKH